MLGVVYSLKYTVGEARPDTGMKNLFPSGLYCTSVYGSDIFIQRVWL